MTKKPLEFNDLLGEDIVPNLEDREMRPLLLPGMLDQSRAYTDLLASINAGLEALRAKRRTELAKLQAEKAQLDPVRYPAREAAAIAAIQNIDAPHIRANPTYDLRTVFLQPFA